MRGNVHVRFGGRERGNGVGETRPPRPLPTRHLSYDTRHADLLYEIVRQRYDVGRSLIVTTNKTFSEWNQVFDSAASVVTLVDRLCHRAEIVEIAGESYRKKEATERDKQRRAQRGSGPRKTK